MLSSTLRHFIRVSSVPLSAMNGAVCCVAIRRNASKCVQIFDSQSHQTARERVQSIPPQTNSSRCIELLLSQQNAIQKSLNALEGWSMRSRVPTESMVDDLQQFCVFFKEYAEDIHFAMEEQMLFPSVRQYMKHSLIPYHQGMYLPSDHDTLRGYIVRFGRDSISKDEQGTLQAISEFITFLRVHSQHTAAHLYPDIQGKVPASVLQDVSNECEQFMHTHREKEARLLRICDALDRKYGPDGAWYCNCNQTNRSHKNGCAQLQTKYYVDFELL